MMLLKTFTDDEVLGQPAELADVFELREAARAVVLNDQNQIALINVVRDGFYKLPGGGIDDGESHEAALRRECQEEIGYDIEIISEIGQTEELRGFRNQKQVSYCYVARAVGDPVPLKLTEKEIRLQQQPEWLGIDTVLSKIENAKPDQPIGKFIQARDVLILRTALETMG